MMGMTVREMHLRQNGRDGRFIEAFLMAALGHSETEIKEALFPELVKNDHKKSVNTAVTAPQAPHN